MANDKLVLPEDWALRICEHMIHAHQDEEKLIIHDLTDLVGMKLKVREAKGAWGHTLIATIDGINILQSSGGVRQIFINFRPQIILCENGASMAVTSFSLIQDGKDQPIRRAIGSRWFMNTLNPRLVEHAGLERSMKAVSTSTIVSAEIFR